MFCPNCGSANRIEQNYCRSCGLKLDAVVEAVADQFPSKEFAESQRRKQKFQSIGFLCLSIAGLIGFALLILKAALYKAELFGTDLLLWSAIGALIGFLLLSVVFFNFPKFFLKTIQNRPPDEEPQAPAVTAKLIEDRPFEPASSVTDNTTEHLKTRVSRRTD